MTHISFWISSSLTQTLAWTLLHFLWQGLALAGVCAAVMAACRSASARYIVALSALALMLAAPVITFFVLQQSAAVRVAENAATVGSSAAIASVAPPNFASASSVPSSPAPLRSDALLWLVEAWFAGVVFFSLRTAGGLIVVQRLRRNQTRPIASPLLEKCRALQRRMHIERVIRYCECLALEAPAVIGWFRPIVLLPVTALSGLSEDQLAAVISHELAHIRRLDSLINLFQIAAETLLFYHPAVWWLNKRIRAERENCCDDAALAVCGNPVEYARALTLMEEWRQRPALAMAANGSPLVARVARMLGIASPRNGIRTAGFAAAALCLAGALFAANALMAAGRSVSPPNINVSLSPAEQLVPLARTNSIAEPRAKVSASFSADQFVPAQSQPAPQSSQSQPTLQSQSSPATSSYVDQMKAQGYDNLTADELISLKVQGVTPEYIQQIKTLGLHPSVNELIALRVQGIDPQYIKDMRATGFNPDIQQLISLRVQGVTPEYVRDMRAAGIDGDANQFISMKVQGLKPDYVKEMKATGLNLSANQLVAMKIQGLDPGYIDQMKASGISANPDQLIGMKVQGLTSDYVKEMKAVGINASINQLIGMKIQGLDPEYVKDMKTVGVTADASQLIGMKVQGLTAEYVKEMTAAGVKAGVNQLIGMKVQGLTPDYVKEMKAEGIDAGTSQLIGMKVQGLTPDYVKDMKALGVNAGSDQWIGLRVEGVTPEYVKSLQSAGLQNLSVDDYIRAREMGITPDFVNKVRSHGFKDLTIDKVIQLKNAGVF